MAPQYGKKRNWCVTINNPRGTSSASLETGTWEQQLSVWFREPKIRYAGWQLERGETGTDHIQGYLEFETEVTMSFAVASCEQEGAHVEPRRGSPEDARDYCILAVYKGKDKGRVLGPWEKGNFGGMQGHRSDLHIVADRIASGDQISTIAMEHPLSWMRYGRGMQSLSTFYRRRTPNEQIHIRVLWGDTRSGKTSEVYKDYPILYSQSDLGWFDGYMGEKVLFFDDFDPDCFSLKLLLKICDRFPLMVKTKGSHVVSNWDTVVFTSNEHPRHWYTDPQGAFKARLDESDDVVKWLNPKRHRVLAEPSSEFYNGTERK